VFFGGGNNIISEEKQRGLSRKYNEGGIIYAISHLDVPFMRLLTLIFVSSVLAQNKLLILLHLY
jgi:hypothetical protein